MLQNVIEETKRYGSADGFADVWLSYERTKDSYFPDGQFDSITLRRVNLSLNFEGTRLKKLDEVAIEVLEAFHQSSTGYSDFRGKSIDELLARQPDTIKEDGKGGYLIDLQRDRGDPDYGEREGLKTFDGMQKAPRKAKRGFGGVTGRSRLLLHITRSGIETVSDRSDDLLLDGVNELEKIGMYLAKNIAKYVS